MAYYSKAKCFGTSGSTDNGGLAEKKKLKKKQIGINHTREGISRGRQPAGQVEGEQ
jgi:hypothetical protein